jgi:hypothetical protein
METFGDFLVTKNEQDEQIEFYCKKCDYTCCKKYNWERHLLASKHIKVTDCSKSKKNEQNINLNHKSVYSCDICQKIYESRNGLWKHKKKCLSFCENKKETTETETKIKESEAKEWVPEGYNISFQGTHGSAKADRKMRTLPDQPPPGQK